MKWLSFCPGVSRILEGINRPLTVCRFSFSYSLFFIPRTNRSVPGRFGTTAHTYIYIYIYIHTRRLWKTETVCNGEKRNPGNKSIGTEDISQTRRNQTTSQPTLFSKRKPEGSSVVQTPFFFVSTYFLFWLVFVFLYRLLPVHDPRQISLDKMDIWSHSRPNQPTVQIKWNSPAIKANEQRNSKWKNRTS